MTIATHFDAFHNMNCNGSLIFSFKIWICPIFRFMTCKTNVISCWHADISAAVPFHFLHVWHGYSRQRRKPLLQVLFVLASCFLSVYSDLQRNLLAQSKQVQRQIDWVMPLPVMMWWLMSLQKLHTPYQKWPFQRSPMLTTSCSGWVTEWWMSMERSPLRGQLEKGPHLKRQLHSAGEGRRYALFWPRSSASLQ